MKEVWQGYRHGAGARSWWRSEEGTGVQASGGIAINSMSEAGPESIVKTKSSSDPPGDAIGVTQLEAVVRVVESGRVRWLVLGLVEAR